MVVTRLPLKGKKKAFIVSAPTMTDPEEVKKFYSDLYALISLCDKLIILGNFNARVDMDYAVWQRIIGRNGTGKCKSNGLLLLQFCTEHVLLITDIVFCLPTCNRASWMHTQSPHGLHHC